MTQTIRAEVQQVQEIASRGTVRTHVVPVDRPVEKGGTDQGPMGGELLLVGLAGCFMSNLLAAIGARGAAVTDVRLQAEAVLDDTPTRMTAYTLRVSARGDDPALFQKLVTIAERGCIVANTLRRAAPIHVEAELSPP